MLRKALEFTGRLQKALGLTWRGLTETMTQIAEKVAMRVDLLKLNQEIDETEKQLETTYRQLGRAFLQLPEASRIKLLRDSQMAFLIARIEQLSEGRKALGRMMTDLQDETILDTFTEFLKMLRRAGSTVEPITLPSTFPSSQARLKELGLPSGTLVIGLQRKDQVMIPDGATSLQPGDRLFLLAPVHELDRIKKLLQERMS